MKKMLIVPALVALVGCASTYSIPAGVDCGPQPTQVQVDQAVKYWVDHVGLKDPGSAQTKEAHVVNRAGWNRGLVNGGGKDYGWEVAFQCNAKNAYGGYTGFREETLLLCPNGKVVCAYILE